jgi:hypothetical protein
MTEKIVQPDPRIDVDQIGTRVIAGWKGEQTWFAVHDYPGCPQNATIEVVDQRDGTQYLRCWACKRALTSMAANHVTGHFKQTERGTFIVP